MDQVDWQPDETAMSRLFAIKYGNVDTTGWAPRQRLSHGYFLPGDFYEAVVDKAVTRDTVWLDVGGGRAIFPDNPNLSKILADRCRKLVAVDPSNNVFEHPLAHQKVKSVIEDFDSKDRFDLATFRMVAEHITSPDTVLDKLCELVNPSGLVLIYTVNKFSPIPTLTRLVPFSMHFKIKKLFWEGEEKDTFPVSYKMNTRRELGTLFESRGFSEEAFLYLDDLSALNGFRVLSRLELSVWRILRSLGI